MKHKWLSIYATPNGVENVWFPLPRVERCAFNPGLCDDTLYRGYPKWRHTGAERRPRTERQLQLTTFCSQLNKHLVKEDAGIPRLYVTSYC